MKRFIRIFFLIFFLPVLSSAQTGLDTLSLRSIFYEPLLAGNRPDFITFSPDESQIYFQANDSAREKEKYFRVQLDGTELERAPQKFVRRFAVSPDGKKILYENDKSIWAADQNFENKQQLINSKIAAYNAIWSPDSHRIAFIRDGNAWIFNIIRAKLTQVTSKEKSDAAYNIRSWAGNNKLILSQWDTSDYKNYYFPKYIGQHVDAGSTRRGIAKETVSVAYLDSGIVKQQVEQKGSLKTSTSASGRYLAVDFIDPPKKHRTITVFDLAKSSSSVVFTDSTKGWIYEPSLAFAPEGNKLMFQSEKGGWNHIYTINPDGSNMQQQTKGPFEISWARWLDENELVYASNQADPGERHMYTLNIKTNQRRKLTSKRGFRQDFHLSRNKQHLVYEYSYFNKPFELYSLNLSNHSKEKRLTYTIPERFKEIDWQKEDYIRLTGSDGQTKLSMSVLKPRDLKAAKKYPVVVFVHGGGSLQNVYKGWSNHYYREYMFNQYLTARGYYVIEVDYRHSTGYGRTFREDVTNWMGKYETRDIVDGIKYLAGHYAHADTSSVGIYGGSYGGFLSLYATSLKPDYFDAAAALRAVTNWQNYYYTNPRYTLPRLGRPEADSAHYARSSPITYVDSLRKPVLILHGLEDNNVGFQDAAQYIDKLIQSGNHNFEMMMYPSEQHSFDDPDDWLDEYSRIYDFFEEKLK